MVISTTSMGKLSLAVIFRDKVIHFQYFLMEYCSVLVIRHIPNIQFFHFNSIKPMFIKCTAFIDLFYLESPTHASQKEK